MQRRVRKQDSSDMANADTVAPHTKLCGNSAGFSLLELLVVIVIIGILVSVATININSDDNRSKKHAERLAALMQLASDESMMHGQEMGLRFYRGQYEFSVLDPNRGIWDVMTDDDMFRPRNLEEDLQLELLIEDQEIVLDSPASEDREEEYLPQIFILSSGEVTPYTVRFRPEFTSSSYSLKVKADGNTETLADEL
jgi:general secretion pathway protein H